MAVEPSASRKWHAPALVFTGLLLCWYGLRVLGASYSITRWPVVPARIIYSSVERASGTRFRPRVEYELYLAGRRYVGAGITRPGTVSDPSVPRFSQQRAESIAAHYPVGMELLAGYDPVNPSRTVLRPRFNWWTTVPVFLGALITALGVTIWRRNRATIPAVSP